MSVLATADSLRTAARTLVLWALFTVLALPSGAQETSLVIDFSSTALRDAGMTTADWDTVSGTLHLPSFTAHELGSVAVNNATQVDVSGNYAYVATGTNGLCVVDISDPASPSLVFNEAGAHTVQDVSIYGELLFAAGPGDGVHVYDISDSDMPAYAGTMSQYTDARRVKALGTLLYVANGLNGLSLVYLHGGAITPITTLDTPGSASDVDAAGGIAVVADQSSLRVIDVSDPTSPVEIGSYAASGAGSVQIEWPWVYLGTTSAMLVLDISDPTSPGLVGTYPAFDVVSVSVEGDQAAVATLGGVEIVDVTNPVSPAEQSSLPSGDETSYALLTGGRVFWADGENFRILESAVPVAIDDYYYRPGLGQNWVGTAAQGDFLYGFRGDDMGREVLTVYGVLDAMNPTVVGEVVVNPTFSPARGDIEASGGYVYLADRTRGIRVFDVQDPSAPVEVNQLLASSDPILDLEVSGSYLVAMADDTLHVLDIYDPANPVELYSVLAHDDYVAVQGNLAYFVNGIYFIVWNLPTGTVLGYTSVGYNDNFDLVADGDWVYFGWAWGELWTMDVSDPTSPGMVATSEGFFAVVPEDMEIIGDRLVTLDKYSVGIMDISNPLSVQLEAGIVLPIGQTDAANNISRTGDVVHVTQPYGGHYVIPVLGHRLNYNMNEARTVDLSPYNTGALASRIRPAARTDSVLITIPGSDRDDGMWNVGMVGGGTGYFQLLPVSAVWGPYVDLAEFQWAYASPTISGHFDVPDDEGGEILLEWMKSANDLPNPPGDPVIQYDIYRRNDPPPQSGPGFLTPESPPGQWDLVASVPANGSATLGYYSTPVPTLFDSTIVSGVYWTTFYVAALTANQVAYESAPDSGYSVDNLAPSVPGNLVAVIGGQGVTLSWNANQEPDVVSYNVYRGSTYGFVPDGQSLIGSTPSPGWFDGAPGGEAYYKVTAVDDSGNEGDPAVTGTTTGIGLPAITNRFHLYPASPNPFRAGSRIVFEVPRGGAELSLAVYDIQGRIVRRLASGRQAEGVTEIQWDGLDDGGRAVSAGIYFVKLAGPDFTAATRLVRVR